VSRNLTIVSAPDPAQEPKKLWVALGTKSGIKPREGKSRSGVEENHRGDGDKVTCEACAKASITVAGYADDRTNSQMMRDTLFGAF
jgi:hypothetical protein